MLSSPLSGSRISELFGKHERRDENHTEKKILNKMFFQETVGYRDAIQLLMVVFEQSGYGVWWMMIS